MGRGILGRAPLPAGAWLLAVALTFAMAGGGPPVTSAAPDPDAIRAILRSGRYAEAERDARRLLSEIESAEGGDSLHAAEVIDLVVESLRRGGKSKDPETLALGARAIRIKESLLGSQAPELAKSLGNLAGALVAGGDFEAARPLFERALRIQETTLGPDHADVATTLNGMGVLLRNTGKYPEACAALERALAIRTKTGEDSIEAASILSTLAAVRGNMGDLEESRRLFERTLRIREKLLGPDHPSLGSTLNNIAVILHLSGDDAGARSLLERALAIQERALGEDSTEVALTLENLGETLMYLGSWPDAKSALERSLAIQEKAFGPDHYEVAATLRTLAAVLRAMGDAASALPLAERALAIRRKVLGPDHPDVASSLANLGHIHAQLGRPKEARGLFEQALAVQEKALGPEHYHLSSTLQELADLLLEQGEDQEARRLLSRAFAIREKVLGPGHPDLAETLDGLARADLASGDATTAAREALRAETIAREYLQRTFRGLSEAEALRLERIRVSGLGVGLSLLASSDASRKVPDAPRRVWDALVRARALVLDEMAARHRAARDPASPEIASLAGNLDLERARLARLVVRGPDSIEPGAYRTELADAEEKEEKAERALAERSESYRSERVKRQVALPDVLSSLPRGDALVAFVVYERRAASSRSRPASPIPSYMAFVLKGDGTDPAAVPLGAAEPIDALIERWRAAVSKAPEDTASEERYRRAGEELRRAIWDPVALRVAGSKTVFVVPDGALSLVSLDTLPAPGDRYLLETIPSFHYLSTERDLVPGAEPGAPGRGVLIVGGPDFDAGPGAQGSTDRGVERTASATREALPSCDSFRRLRFDSLPGALAEADDVEALWSGGAAGERGGRVLKLTGARAEEGAFKRNSPGRKILHVATHGFFVEGACESRLDQTSSAAAHGHLADLRLPDGESPLLLSGLAFSGANHRGDVANDGSVEDGILTAGEIASLDLRGVEWAVLSSCGSGTGPVQAGEGVLGLRRAFQVAGVGTLILSLWALEDHAARDWIRRLYENRLAGRSTVESVRNAELEILRARRRAGVTTHPFYWGAFVAAGRWQ